MTVQLAGCIWKMLITLQCLKDERDLEEAGYDVLKSMSREQVCYAEIRFAPLFSEIRIHELQKGNGSTDQRAGERKTGLRY